MCYNANVSIKAFIIGIIGVICLFLFGNQKYKAINKQLGIFFIFVALMQIVDYFIWIDHDCSKKSNWIAGIFGAILIGLQPLLFYYFFVDKKTTFTNILAILYIFYLIFIFIKALNNLCSNRTDKRPKWSWLDSYSKYKFDIIYPIIVIGSTLLITSNIKLYVAILYGFTFLISKLNYEKFTSEFWCYFSNSIPLLLLLLQKFIL
jgi:hypothetical protein